MRRNAAFLRRRAEIVGHTVGCLLAREDADGDGFLCDQDCDPADPAVHEGAPEVCDGVDQDCDAQVDEGCG
jgi:hypothetical protein